MRFFGLSLLLAMMSTGCTIEVPGGDDDDNGGRPTDGGDKPSREDNEEEENTDEGRDVGDADDGGSSSSGMGGSNSLYIVNYSSYDMCYIASCDCNLDECYEDTSFYLPYYSYVEYSGLEDMCTYVYVEDCDYGYYWENFLDIDGDFTWELYD